MSETKFPKTGKSAQMETAPTEADAASGNPTPDCGAGSDAIDEYTRSQEDYDTVYAAFTTPHRGGVLSERRRYDPRTSRQRLLRDGDAIRWQLHWAVRDLVSSRSWGREQVEHVIHLERRCSQLADRIREMGGELP